MGNCKHFDGKGFCYYFADNRTKEFCETMCEHNCGGEVDEVLECLKSEYVEDFKEELRISELGNKQLCEEIKVLIQERNECLELIKWIKEQYDSDFTKRELEDLEPRDKGIYESTEEMMKKYQ